MTEKIFIPAGVQITGSGENGGMKIIHYKGEWNPYPYKTPTLVHVSLVLSCISVLINIFNVVWGTR